jgi:hypothetical protein
MKKFIIDLFQATIIATLIGGPLFVYMIFYWKP